jgi:hypothetical protein
LRKTGSPFRDTLNGMAMGREALVRDGHRGLPAGKRQGSRVARAPLSGPLKPDRGRGERAAALLPTL